MKQEIFTVTENKEIAPDTFKMTLSGDTAAISNPGQFVDIKISNKFLRRPISVCDCEDGLLTIICKTVGGGTEQLAAMPAGCKLDILTGLGNGYDLSLSGSAPLLIGGGAGVPPLYWLCKKLIEAGRTPHVILGFNKSSEAFFCDEFAALGADVIITAVDGSIGVKGFVTDAMPGIAYSYFYACGPLPMFKAIEKVAVTGGQYSFEERMGCGFGACMGCTCKTVNGSKRICREGPVMLREEVIWED